MLSVCMAEVTNKKYLIQEKYVSFYKLSQQNFVIFIHLCNKIHKPGRQKHKIWIPCELENLQSRYCMIISITTKFFL